MSQPTRGPQPPAAAAVRPIIERLIATVDAETRDLEQGRRIKYEVYSLNKNQALLELNRLLPALAVGATEIDHLGDAQHVCRVLFFDLSP